MDGPGQSAAGLRLNRHQTQTAAIVQAPVQVQRQALTLQARRCLELLRLPRQELQIRLRQYAEQNPFLEYAPPADTVSLDALREADASAADALEDPDYLNNGFEGYGDEADPERLREAERAHDYALSLLTDRETLYGHLERQAASMNRSPGVSEELILFLCGSLAPDGYLRTAKDELLADWSTLHGGILSIDETILERAVKDLQTLDPPGIGARTLQECLLLQVRADSRVLPERALYLRLCRHLASIPVETTAAMVRLLGCTEAEYLRALAYLKTLNPSPGAAFAYADPLPPPDLTAVRGEDGRWLCVCAADAQPQFTLDLEAAEHAGRAAKTAEERRYVRETASAARQLVTAYADRNATLLRIAQAVFDRQQEFLDRRCASEFLEPLHRSEIAGALACSASTVSRAVRDKTVRVPGKRIPVPLAAFFSNAVPSAAGEAGEAVSDHRVRAALRDLIDREDKSAPLSDDALCEALNQAGYRIARRTVAKYRTQLNIPSTHRRRERLATSTRNSP